MTTDAWIAAIVFVVAYVLIAIERPDRTITALIAGLLLVVLGVSDQHLAFEAIDINVIFLLAGMMVIASILADTGFFDWIAIRSVAASDGRPVRLLLILSAVTAVLSAFLDNVTTVVLLTPVMLSVAHRLRVSPVPYLISSILASNIGGTATLIGDPPNILIGSAAGLGFDAFLINLGPVTVVIFALFTVIAWALFRGHLQVPDEGREAALERAGENAIKDPALLAKALIVSAGTLIGFLIHRALGVEPATIALLGAAVLMLVANRDPHKVLRDVEWSTLFFFVGLFMLVEAVVEVGIVGAIADVLAEATGGHPVGTTISLLWFSAIASAIIDNIPYTATAIPIVERLVEAGLPAEPLWWALALGACLGGNLTIVGASANVVVANVARRAGHGIGFVQFLRYGAVVVLMSLVVSSGYLWLRYLS